MKLFVFSSMNLTNIWAGIGAGLWAVSPQQRDNVGGAIQKAQRMEIGSLGILFCKETQALTTPFIVYSSPDPEKEITNVWPETWALAFRMHVLGNPDKQLPKDEAQRVLPMFKGNENRNIGHILHLQPVTVFVPVDISPEDWKIIIERLAI